MGATELMRAVPPQEIVDELNECALNYPRGDLEEVVFRLINVVDRLRARIAVLEQEAESRGLAKRG